MALCNRITKYKKIKDLPLAFLPYSPLQACKPFATDTCKTSFVFQFSRC